MALNTKITHWKFLFKDAFDKHPGVLISTIVAAIMSSAAVGNAMYRRKHGGPCNKFMNVYTVLRPDDPRIKKIRNHNPWARLDFSGQK